MSLVELRIRREIKAIYMIIPVEKQKRNYGTKGRMVSIHVPYVGSTLMRYSGQSAAQFQFTLLVWGA